MDNKHASINQSTGTASRLAWLVVGLLALGFGAVGVVLPLLPTTPFVLFAAFAFTKGSPRMRSWLVGHNIFGPMIRDWETNGTIALRYKIMACSVMTASLIGSYFAGFQMRILIIQVVVMSIAAAYVLTRPSKASLP